VRVVQNSAQRYNGCMLLETSTVSGYFSELGLEPEAARLYLALHTQGQLSMSEISRHTGLERTRVYRLVEQLKEVQLVVMEKSNGRNLVKGAPIANLHALLTKKEQNLKGLQDKLWVIERLLASSTLSSPVTRVQFYQGAEGLREMYWNETKAKGENLSILYENMQGRTGAKFFDQWVRQCNENNLTFRGLICDHFINTQHDWYKVHSNERLLNWESRFVDPTVFAVTHSTVIYDNVVAYYVWKDAEIFGVEITNQQIADAQRIFFEMLWEKSAPVNDLTGVKSSQNESSLGVLDV